MKGNIMMIKVQFFINFYEIIEHFREICDAFFWLFPCPRAILIPPKSL